MSSKKLLSASSHVKCINLNLLKDLIILRTSVIKFKTEKVEKNQPASVSYRCNQPDINASVPTPCSLIFD